MREIDANGWLPAQQGDEGEGEVGGRVCCLSFSFPMCMYIWTYVNIYFRFFFSGGLAQHLCHDSELHNF